MANLDPIAVLQDALAKQDISIWNNWIAFQRETDDDFRPNLTAADLSAATLSEGDFTRADLGSADLYDADFNNADLTDADLTDADLTNSNLARVNLTRANLARANLTRADLTNANLTNTDLTNADLTDADLTAANLSRANFTNAYFGSTVLAQLDLSTVKGPDTVFHIRSSTLDIDTFYRSHGQIPEIFLRGCGVPDTMIAFAKSLVVQANEYYSCFISYSSADEIFARRLHNDLQANGVRVWFAPEDLKIGDPIRQTIDESIKMYDKLIIVLSERSINRAWVQHEVEHALQKEKQHGKLVLFPICLDDSVFHTTEQWAYDLRERYIGDFTKADNPLLYQNAINRLFRDLNAKARTEG